MVELTTYGDKSAALVREAEDTMLEPYFISDIDGVYISTNIDLGHKDVTIRLCASDDDEINIFWPLTEEQDRVKVFRPVDVYEFQGIKLPGIFIRPEELEQDVFVQRQTPGACIKMDIRKETKAGIGQPVNPRGAQRRGVISGEEDEQVGEKNELGVFMEDRQDGVQEDPDGRALAPKLISECAHRCRNHPPHP